jgi:hypothetical protein
LSLPKLALVPDSLIIAFLFTPSMACANPGMFKPSSLLAF